MHPAWRRELMRCLTHWNVSPTIVGLSSGWQLFLSSSCICPSVILFSLFITTVVVPLSSFLRIISLLLISSLRARSSPGGRLFLGLTSGVPQALFWLLLSKSQEQLTVESVESNWISREMDVAQYFGHDRYIEGASFWQIGWSLKLSGALSGFLSWQVLEWISNFERVNWSALQSIVCLRGFWCVALKIPHPPPPHHFSNGPSLNFL